MCLYLINLSVIIKGLWRNKSRSRGAVNADRFFSRFYRGLNCKFCHTCRTTYVIILRQNFFYSSRKGATTDLITGSNITRKSGSRLLESHCWQIHLVWEDFISHSTVGERGKRGAETFLRKNYWEPTLICSSGKRGSDDF